MRDLNAELSRSFPTPSLESWRALVEKSLKGAEFDQRLVSVTADGLKVRPLYTALDAPRPLLARPAPVNDPTRPWDLRMAVDHPDPARANAQIRSDLENGAASVLVRIDPAGKDGVAGLGQDRLERVLADVLLDVAPVALDAGLYGPEAANALAVLAKGAPSAPLAFHLDPLAAFAEAGASPGPIESHLISAAQTAARHAGAYPKASLFLASGRVAHEAGGSEGHELGFMAAAALSYAKAMERAGLSREEAFGRQVLGLSVDADAFLSIAKLRAARAIWARLTEACGVDAPAVIEARSSRRVLSRLDPWVNLLRLTAAAFAGGVGGADAVVLEAFTRPLGVATDFARRQARNTQLVLMEEAALGRVADPAGGSWFLERLTSDLAEAGWRVFQAIEAGGGLIAALESGRLADEIAAVRDRRAADIARRKIDLLGVSQFPDLDQGAVATEAVVPAKFAQTSDLSLPGPDGQCPPLTPIRLAEPFEALRERAAQGQPKAYLATLGTPGEHGARLSFMRNLLAAGGIGSASGPVEDHAGQALAVICGPDERYATEAVDAALILKGKGAKAVWLAGKPGELEAALTSAGVERFAAAGADVLELLQAALTVSEAGR